MLNGNVLSLDFDVENDFQLSSFDLMFGNYLNDSKNWDYTLLIKIRKGNQVLLEREFTLKIIENIWVNFEIDQIRLDSGSYMFEIQQLTDHPLVLWGKEHKFYAQLNGKDLSTIYFDPPGNPTSMLIGEQPVSLSFFLEEDYPVSNISLKFENLESGAESIDYKFLLRINRFDKQIFVKKYLKKIQGNQWVHFELPSIELDAGNYSIEVSQLGNYRLLLFTKEQELWAQLDS